MSRLALACLFVVGACGGDDGGVSPPVDAPPGTPMCTGALYDPCLDATGCMSQNCHFFDQSNFMVCTQPCSASTPCPNDSSGNPATCNNRGICKPAAANVCVP